MIHPARPGVPDYAYRYYDPVTGRWLIRDLIDELGGTNLYSFNFNDPNSFFDVFGNEPRYSNSPGLAAAHKAGVEAVQRERNSFLKDRNEARQGSGKSFNADGAAEAGGRICRKCGSDGGEATYYTTETVGKRPSPGVDATVNPEDAPKCTEPDEEVGKWHTHPGQINGDQFSAEPNFSDGDKAVADLANEVTDQKTGQKKTVHHRQNKNGVPLALTAETERGSGEFITKSYQYGVETTFRP
jgi:hypothetical protein